jgi:YHS domain-containing protein
MHPDPAVEGAHAMATDPVCGMEVEISTTPSALTFEHDGETYYFCSRGCRLEFEEDPDKYLDPDYVPSM